MRTVLLAVLSFLVLAPQAADAARRDERTTQASRQQPTQRAVARPAARNVSVGTPPRAAALAHSGQPTARASQIGRSVREIPSRSARASATRSGSARNSQVVVRRNDVRSRRAGIVVRGAAAATISQDVGNCTRRNGRAICGGNRSMGWQAGLPAMTMEQRDCPAGTFATLARGHDDVIRCMPL
jgi:hypothetical protein